MRLYKGPHPKQVAGARLLKVDTRAAGECLRVRIDMLLSPEDVRTFHQQGLFEWQPTVVRTDLGRIRRNRQSRLDSIKGGFDADEMMRWLNDRSDSDTYVRGYQDTPGPRVHWNKRGRFWTYCEYVECNLVTAALLETLFGLAREPDTDNDVAGERLARLLTALDLFWD